VSNPIDKFIECRCAACTRLDQTTSDTFPDSESSELRACWEEIEKTCPHFAEAFGTACAAVDGKQLDMFEVQP
jgi:hypothetical protein